MMNVRELGRGSAVLLLHGMPSPAAELLPLAEALASSHRVLLPELPGYGSSLRLDPYTMRGAQLAIEDLLRRCGVDRVAVVGFSGGTYRALRLALDARVTVTRIACIGATPGPRASEANDLRQGANALRAGADLKDFFVTRFLSETWRADGAAVAAIKSWLAAAPADVIASKLDAFAEEGDLRARLPELTMPLLLRVGEGDVATPPALSHEIASASPGARLQVVPKCGHALLIEDATATIEAIRAFMAESEHENRRG